MKCNSKIMFLIFKNINKMKIIIKILKTKLKYQIKLFKKMIKMKKKLINLKI